MFSIVLVSMMMSAAAPADPVSAPRSAYSACLKKFLTSNAEKRVEPATFDTAFTSACTAEEASFKSAIVAQQKSMKASAKDAEQAATDWITDLKSNAKETYRDMVGQPSSGT